MRFQIVLKVLILGLFLTGEMEIFGQENYVVTGKVVDSRNEPIEGVSVSIEGQSDVPVITDSEGKFSVTSRMQNNWLIFNPYEKYKMKRIFFSGTREILVYLTDKDIQSGEDIVLDIGLNREKKDVLSTINTVDTKNFRYLGYQSVDQLLQGSVSGVNFINHSGLPGTGGPIFMRGQTSLNGSNQPLIIVDGLPLEKGSLYNLMIEGSVYNPLSALSVQDISRISILKGAATTLYGLKGSNGVILI
ncbi:MAG: TonB-dependent receptor plug domain-containing protein, partial [bacterium]